MTDTKGKAPQLGTEQRPSSRYEHHLVEPLKITDDPLTQQQYKDECDINHILRQYAEQPSLYQLHQLGSTRQPKWATFDTAD